VTHGIALLIYYDEIPQDRQSHYSVTDTSNGEYSFVINSNDIRVGRYFVSVLVSGGSAGELPLRQQKAHLSAGCASVAPWTQTSDW
jgi:hypothetical protein